MRYITNIIAIVLVMGMFLGPLSILAENDGEVASVLGATITAPANNATIQTGVATTFTVSPTGGDSLHYGFLWNFGDGTAGAGSNFAKTYATAGARTVTVTVTDFAGAQATAQITVNVISPISPLVAVIISPANNANFEVGQSINFSSEATGGTPSYAFLWNFGDGTAGAGSNFAKTYATAGARTVTVTVTDFAGAQATANRSLSVTVSPPPIGADTTAPSQPTIINSTISTTATSATGSLTITWTAATDPVVSGQTTSGLAGYSYIIDHNPVTVPDAIVETSAISFTQTLATGAWWFHLMAKDNAGNGSMPVTHYGPMIVETSAVTTDPLTISNIRVTDITPDGAIVRWTTNRLASSRVIYDIISHASIIGQSAPNFGYASSTGTMDVATKVIEHAVAVTGLLPSTTYYFRVLSQ